MSDIVKEGSLDRIIERQLAKRKFVCNNCGCEFIAMLHAQHAEWMQESTKTGTGIEEV